MRGFLTAVIAILALAAWPVGAQTQWRPFEHDALRYSVEMPGAPRVNDRPLTTETGVTGTVTMALLLRGEEGFAAMVARYDAADPLIDSDAAMDAMLAFAKAKATVRRPITVSGQPGLEARYEGVNHRGRPVVGWIRLVAWEGRLYEVYTMHPAGLDEADAQRFVQSFKLKR